MLHNRLLLWYNIRKHNESSDCETGIWRMCVRHGEAKRNHGKIIQGKDDGYEVYNSGQEH